MTRLWIRTLSERVPRPLAGTEAAFFYPLLVARQQFNRVRCDRRRRPQDGEPRGRRAAASLRSGSPSGGWQLESSGVMIVGQPYGVIMQCPAAGGAATPVTSVAAGDPEAHLFPSFLPDGRHFIYLSISRRTPKRTGIYVAELNNPSPVAAKRLLTTGFAATYVAAIDSGPGFLVFARDGALIAQRFDEQQLQPVGEPISLADGDVPRWSGFSASPTTLLYRAPAAPLQLTWFDRAGRDVERVGAPEHVTAFDLSPDGTRAIVARHAPLNTVDQDLWLYDARRDANPRRLTTSPMLEWSPRWAASDRFVFTSEEGEPGLYSQTVSGDRELLMTDRPWPVTSSVSGDGRVILYPQLHDPKTGVDVWVTRCAATRRMTCPCSRALVTKSRHRSHRTDDGWLHLQRVRVERSVHSREPTRSGDAQIHGRRERPAVEGGWLRASLAKRWSRVVLSDRGRFCHVHQHNRGPGFPPADATRLFAVPGALPDWGVTPNGRRFLFAMPISDPRPYQIVRDWQAAIPK